MLYKGVVCSGQFQRLFVTPGLRAEPVIVYEVVLSPRFAVNLQQVLVTIAAYQTVFDLQHDPPAHDPVGVKRDLAVPVTLAGDLHRSAVIRREHSACQHGYQFGTIRWSMTSTDD